VIATWDMGGRKPISSTHHYLRKKTRWILGGTSKKATKMREQLPINLEATALTSIQG